jgi:hypothetical protein
MKRQIFFHYYTIFPHRFQLRKQLEKAGSKGKNPGCFVRPGRKNHLAESQGFGKLTALKLYNYRKFMKKYCELIFENV